MEKDSVNYVVKAAKVKWAKVFEPDGTFPPARWSINVYPGDADKAALLKLGIQMRTDEKDGGEFFTAKRNVETNKGKKMDPPRVVDGLKRPFTDPIGNGSVCNVIVNVYPWTFGKKTGMGAWLDAVQVIEHVPYASTERVDFEPVQGQDKGIGAEDDQMPF
jgi:hypothetical protein